MNRKIVLLAAALLTASVCLAGTPRRSPNSPYQYGKRLYIAVQGGPMVSFSDNASSYAANDDFWGRFGLQGQLSIGYNFTDAFDIRLSGSYNRPAGALAPWGGFFPYRFNAYHLFADAIWDFNSMGENYVSFSPKVYVGVGAAYTDGYTDDKIEPAHSYQYTEGPNLVPGFRFGSIMEFDGKDGFGWFVDFGFEFFTDWYDGLSPATFPFDVDPKLSLGIIYHIPR